MFAARQATRSVFGAAQRRAFSATASNVSEKLRDFHIRRRWLWLTEIVIQATKVAVLGSTGGIGQPLSLLLKLNPRVSELALYDIVGGPGVAADISHINTRSNVSGRKNRIGNSMAYTVDR